MSTGTLTGTYLRPDRSPLSSTVFAKPSVPIIRDETGRALVTKSASAKLDENGHFSLELTASDDLSLDPSGVTYTISIRGLDPVVGVFIPAGDTVDMADVTTVDPDAPAYAAQVSRAEFDALAASVGVGSGGGGGGFLESPTHPGLYFLAGSGLTPVPDAPGFYSIGA